MRKYSTVPTTETTAISRNGALHPYITTRYAEKAERIAPPRLQQVFMTEQTEPAESPPMSSVMAQETPTVDSSAKIATQESHTDVIGFVVRQAGTILKAETRKPAAPTVRRAALRSCDLLAQKSEMQPPNMSPSVPANKS